MSRSIAVGACVLLAIVVVVEAAAVTRQVVPAERSQRATRILDRTMACTMPLHAGLRQVQLAAASGIRDSENRSLWKVLASLRITTGGDPGYIADALLRAGVGAPEPRDMTPFGSVDQGLAVASACRVSSARPALSLRGLPQGGAASQLGDAYECVTTRTTLIRVRTVFRGPTRLRRFGDVLTTSESVREAAVIVHTANGRPLAYASASESGKARLFTANSCLPD